MSVRSRIYQYYKVSAVPLGCWAMLALFLRLGGWDFLHQFKYAQIVLNRIDWTVFILALFLSLRSARIGLSIWENGLLTFLFIEICFTSIWLLFLTSEQRPITLISIWQATCVSFIYSIPGTMVISPMCHFYRTIFKSELAPV